MCFSEDCSSSTKAYGSRMSTTKFSVVAKDYEAGCLDLVLGCTYNDIPFEEPSRHKKNQSELKQRF